MAEITIDCNNSPVGKYMNSWVLEAQYLVSGEKPSVGDIVTFTNYEPASEYTAGDATAQFNYQNTADNWNVICDDSTASAEMDECITSGTISFNVLSILEGDEYWSIDVSLIVPTPPAQREEKALSGNAIGFLKGKINETVNQNLGKVKTLTSEDYNWNVTTKDTTQPFNAVALWLLEPGTYNVTSGFPAYISRSTEYSSSTPLNAEAAAYIVSALGSFGYTIIKVLPNKTSGLPSTFFTAYNVIGTGEYSSKQNFGGPIDDLTHSTASAQPLSAKQGYLLDNKIADIAVRGAGAPTTSTSGKVGTVYEDTTNGKLYICTAVSGNTYTWQEVGGSNSSITELTTGDYNYPTDNPSCVNVYSLPVGIYTAPDNVAVAYSGTSYTLTSAQKKLFFVTDDYSLNNSNTKLLIYTYVSAGASEALHIIQLMSATNFTDYGRVLTDEVTVDNLTSTSTKAPLSANQGKVLKDLIDNAGGAIELTEDLFNWNSSTHTTTNPDAVALWLLDPGCYSFSDTTVPVYYDSNVSMQSEGLVWVTPQQTSSGYVGILEKTTNSGEIVYRVVDTSSGIMTVNNVFYNSNDTLVSVKGNIIQTSLNRAPTSSDYGDRGQVWVYMDANQVPHLYVCGGTDWGQEPAVAT